MQLKIVIKATIGEKDPDGSRQIHISSTYDGRTSVEIAINVLAGVAAEYIIDSAKDSPGPELATILFLAEQFEGVLKDRLVDYVTASNAHATTSREQLLTASITEDDLLEKLAALHKALGGEKNPN